ncbi:MAG: hypothetical protein M5U31_14005 [Acidimicrobiia bacterium]|nr:hypothetical protein [Acidimicrobiia bacterium]
MADGGVERAAGQADRERPSEHAPLRQDGQALAKAGVLFSDEPVGGNDAAVEVQLRQLGGMHADLGHRAALQSCAVAVDGQHGQSPEATRFERGAGHDQDDVGEGAVRDVHLRSVEDVVVAVAAGREAGAGDVCPGVGFRVGPGAGLLPASREGTNRSRRSGAAISASAPAASAMCT